MSQSIEFRDPADLPESSYWPDPIDAIEPIEPANDHRYISQMLCDAFIHLANGKGSLVGMGRLTMALLCEVLPDRFPNYECVIFQKDDAQALGETLYKLWDWLADAQGGTYIALGMRAHILLALARPDLINGMTFEEIGAMDNSTRQNTGKLISDIRDILQGVLRAPAMKSEETRDKCSNAQRRAA